MREAAGRSVRHGPMRRAQCWTRLAGQIKGEPDAAAFSGTGVRDAAGQTLACRALIGAAGQLAAGH